MGWFILLALTLLMVGTWLPAPDLPGAREAQVYRHLATTRLGFPFVPVMLAIFCMGFYNAGHDTLVPGWMEMDSAAALVGIILLWILVFYPLSRALPRRGYYLLYYSTLLACAVPCFQEISKPALSWINPVSLLSSVWEARPGSWDSERTLTLSMCGIGAGLSWLILAVVQRRRRKAASRLSGEGGDTPSKTMVAA